MLHLTCSSKINLNYYHKSAQHSLHYLPKLLIYTINKLMKFIYCVNFPCQVILGHASPTIKLVKRDRVLLGMERTDPEDRQAWRGHLRPRLGSQAAPSAED